MEAEDCQKSAGKTPAVEKRQFGEQTPANESNSLCRGVNALKLDLSVPLPACENLRDGFFKRDGNDPYEKYRVGHEFVFFRYEKFLWKIGSAAFKIRKLNGSDLSVYQNAIHKLYNDDPYKDQLDNAIKLLQPKCDSVILEGIAKMIIFRVLSRWAFPPGSFCTELDESKNRELMDELMKRVGGSDRPLMDPADWNPLAPLHPVEKWRLDTVLGATTQHSTSKKKEALDLLHCLFNLPPVLQYPSPQTRQSGGQAPIEDGLYEIVEIAFSLSRIMQTQEPIYFFRHLSGKFDPVTVGIRPGNAAGWEEHNLFRSQYGEVEKEVSVGIIPAFVRIILTEGRSVDKCITGGAAFFTPTH
jgi:hypothetical protein